MPLKPDEAEIPSMEPALISVPSCWMAKMPMVPFPELRVKRNLPSALTVISRFVAPVALLARTVPGKGVRAPELPMANPEIVAEPAFET